MAWHGMAWLGTTKKNAVGQRSYPPRAPCFLDTCTQSPAWHWGLPVSPPPHRVPTCHTWVPVHAQRCPSFPFTFL